MSLRRIALRDFVIVPALELDLPTGFVALTGETGAGKSILIDALQLALGARADAGVVREGAPRCDIVAEFDRPMSLRDWLDSNGIADDDALLLRRTVDADGRSRAWINGTVVTMTQLRQAADHLVDIHGQHAWQSLTRPASVGALFDNYAGVDGAALEQAWSRWREARHALNSAQERQANLRQDSERLTWQIGELDKLNPQEGEWAELETRHGRLANAQALIDASQFASGWLDEQDDSVTALLSRALDTLQAHAHVEPALESPLQSLQSALAQVQDAVHDLHHLQRTEPDQEALAELDQRLSLWHSLARRFRVPPDELPALMAQWKAELARLDAALDLETLERQLRDARSSLDTVCHQVGRLRQKAAPKLNEAVTAVMQTLGMQGGRFEVALLPEDEPTAHGMEQVEFRVAGHPGVTPRSVGKVASGGELSRIALALSVITSRLGEAPTLIFDEVDAGIGGAVASTVGRLMRQLGADRQVLAVTHLAQVAASANHHLVVSKHTQGKATESEVKAVGGDARVRELARMLGGNDRSDALLAHARELLDA
ncbi:MAG: DNA repair protein RecN [Hydrogenophaga sp.]|uniref:DNA repair protein RecN n=1 Tax=Hydrogenophaga sp. TaxID=1904254 RepID=UPI001DF091A5|nr:DNA repair protein RecN [Hydrogenophaga sp.]MBX3610764.1 DNA repair protein RecN [Hydrogenophaga sp.]